MLPGMTRDEFFAAVDGLRDDARDLAVRLADNPNATQEYRDRMLAANRLVEVELVVGEEPEEGVEVALLPACGDPCVWKGCAQPLGHGGGHCTYYIDNQPGEP